MIQPIHAAPLSFIQLHMLLFSTRLLSFPSFTSYHFSIPFLTSPPLLLPRLSSSPHISPLFSPFSSCCLTALYDGRSDSPARYGSRTLPTQQTLVSHCMYWISLHCIGLGWVGSGWTFTLDFLCSFSIPSFETPICHTMYA